MAPEKLSLRTRLQALSAGTEGFVGGVPEIWRSFIRSSRYEGIALGTQILSFLAQRKGHFLSAEREKRLQITRPYFRQHLEYMDNLKQDGFKVFHQPTLPNVGISDEFLFVAKLVSEECRLAAKVTWKAVGIHFRFAATMFSVALKGELDEEKFREEMRK